LLQQAELVVSVKDSEIRRQPDLFSVTAQRASAERVERAQPQPFNLSAEYRAYSLVHLAGGLISRCLALRRA
jgi:hypothetical protein